MSHSIQRQIHAIGRRARRLLVVHGLCWFIAIAVAVGLVLGGIDYAFRLQDHGVRIILSLTFGLSLVGGFRRFVLPALRRRYSDLEVAQQVERRFPQLGDQLSSSLEFLRGNTATDRAESRALQQSVISQTEALVRPLQLGDCLDPRATRRAVLACLPLLIAIGAVAALDFESTSLAARRLAAPWSHESWPRWHSLEVVKPPERIALGHDFAVEVIDRRGRLPAEVKLQFWFDGDEPADLETVSMQRVEDRFRYTRGNVTRSLQYRAVGGDDDSMDWHSLEVVEPARIVSFQATVQPPSYTGLPEVVLPAGPIRVLEGSQVAFSGRTSRPVEQIRVHLHSGDEPQVRDATVDLGDASFTLAALPSDAVGKGEYWVELIEANGLVSGSDTRAAWEVVADQVPVVTVSAPATDMYFTPTAIVPLQVTATDDLAVQSLQLQAGTSTIGLFTGPPEPARRDELPAQGDIREVSHALNLGEFSLAPHDTLELVFTAGDYRPQTSAPVIRSITIISREDFDYRAQEKQKLLLQRLVEALRLQQATRAQVASLQTQMSAVGGLSDDDASLLRSSELQQQQVGRLLDEQPGGAAQVVAELIASLRSNQLAGSDAASRMQQIAQVLERINRHRLPDLQSELVRATKSARLADGEGDDITNLLASVGDRQEAVADDLQAMIEQLGQWDDHRRFSQDVAKLLRDQQELSQRVSQLPTIGQRFESLLPQQRADLERAAGEQRELARRFDRLQMEMDRLRERVETSDPTASATLAEALQAAGAGAIAEQMRSIGDDVARNRLGNAAQAQRDVEQGLQQVLGALTKSNRSDRDPDQGVTPQQVAMALTQLKPLIAGIQTRQQALLDETNLSLDTGTSLLTAPQMASQQQQLGDETRQAHEQLPLPNTFTLAMTSLEGLMNQAAALLAKASPNESVRRLQNHAVARLRQLLAALDTPSPPDDGNPASDNAADGQDEAGEANPDESPDSLSVEELRLLYAMQVDIHDRTVELQQRRQGRGVLADAEEQELKRLAIEQGQLAELLMQALPDQDATNARPQPTPAPSELDDALDRALEKASSRGSGADE